VLHPEFGDQILHAFAPKSKNLKALQSEESTALASGPSSAQAASEIPEVALQGQRWLMKLPGDHFVLEFQTYATAQEAQKEIEGKEWLKRAYVVPVLAEGSKEAKFLLVDGPFRTAEMAKKAASRMPNSGDIVIENVNELKGVTASRR
jgi:septal ring-binding cell division protein DamX